MLAKNPGVEFKELARLMAARWNMMSKKEQVAWEKKTAVISKPVPPKKLSVTTMAQDESPREEEDAEVAEVSDEAEGDSVSEEDA